MSARVVGIASIAFAFVGCALVSGLANLEVASDASTGDAAKDVLGDVTVLPDVVVPLEAGPGGWALSTHGGCASGPTTVQLSNLEFTVTLWLRVDALPQNDTDVLPILWNGGRAGSEQGWSLDLTSKGIVFCVSDQNGFTCTPPAPMTVGHLVHVGVVSPYNQQTSGRSFIVYAMDRSSGATTHTQVATTSGAQGNWSSSAPFTIGGAQVGQSCTTPSNVTVDRIHVLSSTVTASTLDSTATSSACTSTGVIADLELDEGSGTATKSCSGDIALSWPDGTKLGFVISPFP